MKRSQTKFQKNAKELQVESRHMLKRPGKYPVLGLDFSCASSHEWKTTKTTVTPTAAPSPEPFPGVPSAKYGNMSAARPDHEFPMTLPVMLASNNQVPSCATTRFCEAADTTAEGWESDFSFSVVTDETNVGERLWPTGDVAQAALVKRNNCASGATKVTRKV